MKPPSKLWSLVKLFFAVPLVLGFLGGVFADGYQGAGLCIFFGLMLGLFGRLALVGLAGLAGKRIPGKISWGLAAATMVMVPLVGPALSASTHKSTEADMWKLLEASSTLQQCKEYEHQVPEPFRRPEYPPVRCLADVKDAMTRQDVASLRKTMHWIHEKHDGDKAYQPALDEASTQLQQLYAAAFRSLSGKGADPRLQEAFRTLLNDLGQQESGTVYVLFKNHASLKAPASDARMLAEMRREPEVKKAFPKGDAPVLAEGEAFSQAFDMKRRDMFMTVARESFGKVFQQQGLFELAPLPPGKEPKGNLVFFVDSGISRTPTFFIHTRGEEKRVQGFLFGIQVEWNFAVADRSGKVLYSSKTRSEPAKSLRFRVQEDDPAWAPYSIMMDSAYSNFARQTVARFGIEPPPEKAVFTFKN